VIPGRSRQAIRVPGQPEKVEERNLSAEEIALPPDALRSLDAAGAARVTVSMDMKDNNYGNAFGAFVSVSLACRQDEPTVREAYEVAAMLVQEMITGAHRMAGDAYDASHRK